jgi:hypothetical protein
VAYTFLLPQGWKNESSFHWAGQSFVANLKATSPDGAYFVDKLEPMNMQYSSGSGQQSHGIQFNKATDFLEAIVHKGQETGQSSNVRILEETNSDLPLTREQLLLANSPQTGGMFRNQFHQNGFLKVSYLHNGVQTISVMGATVAGTNQGSHMQLGFGSTARQYSNMIGAYVIQQATQIVYPENPSSQRMDEAKLVAGSDRMGDAFCLYCAKLALAMAVGSREATERELKEFTENMREEGVKRQEQFREQMAAKDATTHDFCNYLLDQQDYHLQGGIVTLPTSYNGWYDPVSSTLLVSADPHYVPSGAGMQTYEQLQKVRPNQD